MATEVLMVLVFRVKEDGEDTPVVVGGGGDNSQSEHVVFIFLPPDC